MATSEKPPNFAPPTTASPIFHAVTPSPTASTSPDISRPGMKGRGGLCWYSPRVISRAGKLTAAARTPPPAPASPGTRLRLPQLAQNAAGVVGRQPLDEEGLHSVSALQSREM